MSPPQTKWYFHWRGRVRRGEYAETDMAYIFLYAYEIINGIGWTGAQDGVNILLSLWEAYHSRFPRLDTYLTDWIVDLALATGLPPPIDRLAAGESGGRGIMDMILFERLCADPIALSFGQILRLSDYDPRQGKLYPQHAHVYEELLPNVLRLCDRWYAKTGGARVVQALGPGASRAYDRVLFRSAVYDESLYGRVVRHRLHNVLDCERLRDFVTRLCRFTENRARERLSVAGRLRGVSLDPSLEELLTRYIKQKLTPGEKKEPEESTGIVIDPEKVARLMEDSAELLGKMLEGASFVGEEPLEDDTPPEEDHAAPLPESADPWEAFCASLTGVQREILRIMLAGGDERAAMAAANRAGTMPEPELDGINEVFQKHMGDLLVLGGEISGYYTDELRERLEDSV